MDDSSNELTSTVSEKVRMTAPLSILSWKLSSRGSVMSEVKFEALVASPSKTGITRFSFMSLMRFIVSVRYELLTLTASSVSRFISFRSSDPICITISGQSGEVEKVVRLVLPGVKDSF